MFVDWIRSDSGLLAIVALMTVAGVIACGWFHAWGHEKGYRKGCEDGKREGFRDAQLRYDEGYSDGQYNYAKEHAPNRDAKGRFTH